MALKKGQKIWRVFIEDGNVTAFSKDKSQIKLTRTQRTLLSSYKSKTYLEDIFKEFGNREALDDAFEVIKDQKLVYTLAKGRV